jgi:hypothetical protein
MKAQLSISAILFALQCLATDPVTPKKAEDDIKTEE